MKSKWIAGMMIAMLILPAAACGSKEQSAGTDITVPEAAQEQEAAPTQTAEDTEGTAPEQKLNEISGDFAATMKKIIDAEDALFEKTGTYDEYVDNRQLVTDWYNTAISESEALFTRTHENAQEYFRLIAGTIDHDDYDAIDDAVDEFYDVVYDDAMDDYYDDIYDDAMDDMYDHYYDGVMDDAYDQIPYEEWNDALTECYREWSDAGTALYRLWSDAGTGYYRMWSAISSKFYSGNFDVDSILESAEDTLEEEDPANMEKLQDDAKAPEEETPKESAPIDNIDPAFKEAMDSYEAFFDEYVEFMKKYENATEEELTGMLADYNRYLSQYIETTEKLESIDEDELTTEELQYYLELNTRINEKLAEIL